MAPLTKLLLDSEMVMQQLKKFDSDKLEELEAKFEPFTARMKRGAWRLGERCGRQRQDAIGRHSLPSYHLKEGLATPDRITSLLNNCCKFT